MQMRALRRLGIGVGMLYCLAGLAPAGESGQLSLERICHEGFQGDFRVVLEGGQEERVRFRVCPTPPGCSVWLEDAGGRRLIEVEATETDVRVRLAGVDPRTATAEDIRTIREFLDAPPAEAARRLPRELQRLGLRPDAPALQCLALATQALEKP